MNSRIYNNMMNLLLTFNDEYLHNMPINDSEIIKGYIADTYECHKNI